MSSVRTPRNSASFQCGDGLGIPFSLKQLHSKIVMHLVIFRWPCLWGFYGMCHIIVPYLFLFFQTAFFSSPSFRAPVFISRMKANTLPGRERPIHFLFLDAPFCPY